MAEATKLYHVVSTSRHVKTRTVRAQNATHSGLKQFIGGTYRLIRNRPLVLPEAEVQKYIEELRSKQALGMLEVRTPDGRLVNLDTLKVVGKIPVTPPKPHPPQDSIANDDTWGEQVENVPGGKSLQQAMNELDAKNAARKAAEVEEEDESEEAQELADESEEETEDEESVEEESTASPKARKRGRRTPRRSK